MSEIPPSHLLSKEAMELSVAESMAARSYDDLVQATNAYGDAQTGPHTSVAWRASGHLGASLEVLVRSQVLVADVLASGVHPAQLLEERAASLLQLEAAIAQSPVPPMGDGTGPYSLDEQLAWEDDRERARAEAEAIQSEAAALDERLASEVAAIGLGDPPLIEVASIDIAIDNLVARARQETGLQGALETLADEIMLAAIGGDQEQLDQYEHFLSLGVPRQEAADLVLLGEPELVLVLEARLAEDRTTTLDELLDEMVGVGDGTIDPTATSLEDLDLLVGMMVSARETGLIDEDGGDDQRRVQSVAVVGELSGNRQWTGERLGMVVAEAEPAPTYDQRWHAVDPDLGHAVVEHLDDPATALAFFNLLGASQTAALLSDDDLDVGGGFAQAMVAAANHGPLEVTGYELLRQWQGLGTHPVHHLAVNQDLPDQFLKDAAAAAFDLLGEDRAAWSNLLMGFGPYTTAFYGNEARAAHHIPALVLFDLLAERDIDLVFELTQEVADPAMFLRPPTYHADQNQALIERFGETLADLPNPAVTGNREQSAIAGQWLVAAAGDPKVEDLHPEQAALTQTVATAVAEAILFRPTMLVQNRLGETSSGHLIGRPEELELGSDTVNRALSAVVEGGGGTDLARFQDVLVAEAVLRSLEGEGVGTLEGGPWLGEMSGRIDLAFNSHAIDQAEIADTQAMLTRLFGTATGGAGIGAGLAAAFGVGGVLSAFALNVGTGIVGSWEPGGFLSTSNTREALEAQGDDELKEIEVFKRQAMGILAEDGLLFQKTDLGLIPVAPAAVEPEVDYGEFPYSETMYVITADGSPQSFADWAGAAYIDFDSRNDAMERVARARLAAGDMCSVILEVPL